MADGYLETHYAEYQQRKAAWEKKKQSFTYQLKLKNRNGTKDSNNPA